MEALIASAYLAGNNTRRVKRALGALFKGAIGKDVVSRTWRKVKTDWEAWTRRDLAQEDVVRLILDGSVVRVRLDRKATNMSLWAGLGVCRDGQKILLAVRNMGGESEAAWRGVLDNLVARGLGRRPSSSSSTAPPDWRRRLPRCGLKCRPSAARCTSTAICWRTRLTRCTTRSPPMTTT